MAKKQIKTNEIVDVVEETAEKVAKAAEETAEKVAKAAEDVAEGVKKVAPKAAKKVAKAAGKASDSVKKAAAKKEMKTSIVLQYGEKEIDSKEMIAAVKKEWTKSKRKISEIKTMELYIKPEDYAVYYVINDEVTGKVWL